LKSGQIVRLVEKPKEPPSHLALVGIYLFRKGIFDAISRLEPSWRNELEIRDAIQTLLEDDLEVPHGLMKDWRKDIGRPEDILEANQLVLSELSSYNKGSLDSDVKTSGIVCIDEGTVVQRGTTLRGPPIIGKNCQIGPDRHLHRTLHFDRRQQRSSQRRSGEYDRHGRIQGRVQETYRGQSNRALHADHRLC
jgi:glucose-1-phosphate thymidylyltransferase